jgi:phosphoglycerate dehydrogenase-like enzyme
MDKPKLLLAVERELFPSLFSAQEVDLLGNCCDLIVHEPPASPDAAFLRQHIAAAEIIITSWRTARLDESVLEKAPRLRLVAHAAGTVKPIVSEALWEKEIQVTSAAGAIAHGVAEFCLGLILTGTKRVFWLAKKTRQGEWRDSLGGCFGGVGEIYQQKVGIIGAGHVGRLLIGLLRAFHCEVLVYDPYLSGDQARELGVRRVETLDEIFSQCLAISLNAPSTPETEGMLRGRHFAQLQPGAVFINTARGKLIHEAELIEELRKLRFVACLDVTETEPCPPDHPFRSLPNVLLTPHIAGAVKQNRLRIGTYAAEEVRRYCEGRPPRFPVRQEQLASIG